MKKIDLVLIVYIVVSFALTFVFRYSISVPWLVMLTTLIPSIVLPVIGGHFVYKVSKAFSFFNILIASSFSALIILGYSLIFPWNELIKSNTSNVIEVNMGISNILFTLITESVLTAFIFFMSKKIGKRL